MGVIFNRENPFVNFRFVVAIEGIDSIGFQSVSGLGSITQVTEHREGGTFTPRLLPEITRFEPIVLRKGLTVFTKQLQFWREQVYNTVIGNAGVIRRTIFITIRDKANGREPIKYKIKKCWPSSLMGPDLDAMADSYAFITMTLQNEGQERLLNRPKENVLLTYYDVTANLLLKKALPRLRMDV